MFQSTSSLIRERNFLSSVEYAYSVLFQSTSSLIRERNHVRGVFPTPSDRFQSTSSLIRERNLFEISLKSHRISFNPLPL
ncbi:hypothetical protein LEP1GSC186_3148 [Leptospira noguchii serovar Autumnalis str. ZUN142]|uniref:Uncharacterized protein n=1 Tax=Leptospira noguchii serovar Autumnalis str. ZUN142 TaxID=1085540 RepID=M6UUG5_9LEPT|nr:hypothetical protein LEP1GSC186_3148 [Leptospira noguchii serovar Autumnalis str. ZUN142]